MIRIAWSVVQDLIAAARRWQEDDASLMAAAVSYYAALSLFPLLLVLIAGLGMVLRNTDWGYDAETQVLAAVQAYGSESVRDSVEEMLHQVKTKAGVGGPLGLLGLILAAVALFSQFENAFDKIWEVPQEKTGLVQGIKNFILGKGKAFLMVLGLGFVLLLNLAAGIGLSSVRNFSDELLPGTDVLWKLLQMGVSVGITTLVFGTLYWQLPKVTVPIKKAFCGGLFTAVAWTFGQWLLAAILVGDRFSAYGIVGSFIAVLVWIYYAAAIVFLGAEFVQVICKKCNGS